ncbi:MAG: DUF6090 family protein [Flavobacteriaceae bacterium]
MAKLFNNIRKKLVAEKPSATRTSNYLKYAIGEIVLVVIGILIALSINNWNNARIKNKDAISLSNRLLIETTKNKKALEEQILRVKNLQIETKSLLTMFGPKYKLKNSRLLDSLIYSVISTPLYNANSTTLNEALNTGQISILQSDSIRALLYDIPQRVHNIKNYEEEMIRDIENNIMPYLYENISFRQMDEEFSDEFDLSTKSKLKYFDNRVVLSKKKFENMVDNKYFLLETLLIGYADLHIVYSKTIQFFEAK